MGPIVFLLIIECLLVICTANSIVNRTLISYFIEDLLGCHEDVTEIIHAKCSGKQECNFKVFDAVYAVKPCRGVDSYLEVTFDCMKGLCSLIFLMA